MEARTATAEIVRRSHIDLNDLVNHHSVLAAREVGRFRPGKLGRAFDRDPSWGSRAMSGDPNGGVWFRNTFVGLVRFATHPDTDPYALITRMEIVVRRLTYRVQPTSAVLAAYWRRSDDARDADRDIALAIERHDGAARAQAEARRANAGKHLSAAIEELLGRGIDPLTEGRPR